jgi:hypothetical protein
VAVRDGIVECERRSGEGVGKEERRKEVVRCGLLIQI